MNQFPKTDIIKFSSYQKLLVALLALTQFTVVLDFMVMSPLGDILMKSMKLKPDQFGIVVSAYAFSAGISGLLTAGFADRFDRKKLLMFFYIGFILGTLSCALADSYYELVAARIITGIFGGVIGSVSMAIVADLFLLQQRGRVMGLMQMGFGASQVLGIPISLFLANLWDWKAPFYMIVGLASIVLILIMINMKPITRHLEVKSENNALMHLFKTLVKRDYRVGYLATALLSLGGFMMMPWGSAFAINNLGVTEYQLPLLFMIAGVATLIIMPIIGKLSDRFDKFRILAGGSFLMIAVVLIYTNLAMIPFWLVIVINVFMMMAIMGRMVPSMALVSALPQLQDRGAFMSINSSLQQISGGVAAAIGGLIVIQETEYSPLQNYNVVGVVVCVLTLICILAVYRVNTIVSRKALEEVILIEKEEQEEILDV